jgi:hypothetical protein
MPNNKTYKLLTYLIALVWIANGLFCKVFDLVPRHQLIVARILGPSNARTFTVLIGLAETAMAAWIISGIRSKWNALAQIIIIAAMNTLEFFLAPDLLLWSRFNALFAFLFILLIYFNECYLNKQPALQA